MNILIIIGSDRPIVIDQHGSTLIVEFVDLERAFPKEFLKFIEGKNVKNVYVLNGPGSFTIMRVCALTINMYAQSSGVNLYVLNKKSLLENLIIQKTISPTGRLFLGQRKKLALASYKDGNWSYVMHSVDSCEGAVASGEEDFWIDTLFDHNLLPYLPSDSQLSFGLDGSECCVTTKYEEKRFFLQEFFTKVSSIEPVYASDPV